MQIHKILFVDDDSDEHELFTEIVYSLNPLVQVVHVEDACEMEEFLHPPLPGLIVLDMQMPKMDGIECLKGIRKKKELDHIPVVMYSVLYARVEEAFDAGANFFIVKEGSLDSMKRNIAKMLAIN